MKENQEEEHDKQLKAAEKRGCKEEGELYGD